MAKHYSSKPQHQTGRTITTKTAYGSTSDMVVTDEKILAQVKLHDDLALLKDDDGYYFTPKYRIDNGLADPMRYTVESRKAMKYLIKEDLKSEDQ